MHGHDRGMQRHTDWPHAGAGAAAAAALGALFVIGRQLYFNAYLASPRDRGRGFLLGFLATLTLLLGGLGGAVADLIARL